MPSPRSASVERRARCDTPPEQDSHGCQAIVNGALALPLAHSMRSACPPGVRWRAHAVIGTARANARTHAVGTSCAPSLGLEGHKRDPPSRTATAGNSLCSIIKPRALPTALSAGSEPAVNASRPVWSGSTFSSTMSGGKRRSRVQSKATRKRRSQGGSTNNGAPESRASRRRDNEGICA